MNTLNVVVVCFMNRCYHYRRRQLFFFYSFPKLFFSSLSVYFFRSKLPLKWPQYDHAFSRIINRFVIFINSKCIFLIFHTPNFIFIFLFSFRIYFRVSVSLSLTVFNRIAYLFLSTYFSFLRVIFIFVLI